MYPKKYITTTVINNSLKYIFFFFCQFRIITFTNVCVDKLYNCTYLIEIYRTDYVISYFSFSGCSPSQSGFMEVSLW